MRHVRGIAVLLALSTLAAVPVFACGVCVEDKIAATYDHAVVVTAGLRGHRMVFGEIAGAVDMRSATGRIASAAARVRGIGRGTLRTSTAPPAFSFALKPTRSAESAVSELQRRLHDERVKLNVLRVMPSENDFTRQ